jgi:antitoxin YefM
VLSVTYTEARARLARLWDRIIADRDVVVIRRRGKEDVAMLPAAELSALMETAHLLRSPRNAERLLAALARAREGHVEATPIEALKREVGLG